MKNIKKIICSLITLTTVLSSVNCMNVAKDVFANGNEVNVNLKEGQDYIIDSGNVTDNADGNVISMENSYDSFSKLYNHNSSGNGFSTTANSAISLSDATFKFTCVDETNGLYTIYNKKTNQYYTQQSSAGTYFTSNAINMKVSKTEDGFFKICKSNGDRYIVFFLTNMDFNGYGDSRNTNNSTDLYDLTLLEKQNEVSSDDIIPGYKKASSIVSGNSYLITAIYNNNVYLLYPDNGTADQTKLVKYTYYDLYNIGSSTPSNDTVEQNQITMTNTDNGYTLQSSNGKYMNNARGSVILTDTITYFSITDGKENGKFHIKDTTNNRYYVLHFHNQGYRMEAMSDYIASRDGNDVDYNWMIFEKTDNLDLNSLVPGYTQVMDINTLSVDKQYIMVYEKESGNEAGTYVVNISGTNQNTNNLRKLEKREVKFAVTGLQCGKDIVIVDGTAYNFTVVKNLASGKTPTTKWSDGSNLIITSGTQKATNGTIDTNDYLEFGKDNNTKGSYMEIDLGQVSLVNQIDLYRFWNDGRTYRNTVVAISNDPMFYNYKVIYNSDANNVHGLGLGNESTYAESPAGKSFVFDDTTARYVRVYMNGQSDTATTNHIVELEVYGYAVTPDVIESDSVLGTKNDTYVGNYLFEGYYTDDTCETVQAKAQYLANDSYVAKYVNPNVLTVKGQAKREDNGNYTIRFVSSVASLNLEEVGFEISKNSGNVKDISTTTVYTQIKEKLSDTTLFTNPSQVFNNTQSEYFFIVKITGIKETNANDTITITPYWIPHGSDKKVKGTTRTETLKTFMDSAPETIAE